MKNYSLYEHPNITNFRQLISRRVNGGPDNVAFQFLKGKETIAITYKQFEHDINALTAYFRRNGFVHNKIAVLGENSYQWILTYFAVALSSNIVVPIDKELEIDDIGGLLIRCGASIIVCSDTYIDIAEALRNQGVIETIFNMRDFPAILSDNIEEFDIKTDENAVCSIIFTSGTTGEPKGVMLTQRSIMLDAVNACRNLCVNGPSLLTLPLHHTFGFSVGVLAELVYGYPICISKSLRTFNRDMVTFHPQNMILVPLYVETMYKSIWRAAKEAGREEQLKKLIVISNLVRKCGIDLRRKLFSSVLEQFGGRLNQIICGGAFLDQTYIDGLDDIGIQVLNGYGITECSPVVSVNRNKYSKKNSVGLPLPGCEVKIIDGEICIKGDIVMAGYYQDEAATQEVMEDGWFKTGDLGYLDDDGFLFITGRKKNLIILSNGKNVSPEELEAKLLQIDGIQEVVVSEKVGMIAAEIYAENQSGIEEGITTLNKELPTYKRIQKVTFRSVPFEKTTTQKIRRGALRGKV